MQESHEITEIGLRRSAGFGECPVYQVVIREDGSFDYVGEQHVERLGEHTGSVSRQAFNKLAKSIKEAGFMDLEESYAVPLTCQATVRTTVVIHGVKKTVSNYGGGGPAALQEIEELIDKLVLEADWDQ